MHFYRKPVAVFLLLLFGLLTFPRELFHELHGCHDTYDHDYAYPSQKQISDKHHHCELLQLDSPVWCEHVDVQNIQFISYSSKNDPCYQVKYFSASVFFGFGRSPPVG